MIAVKKLHQLGQKGFTIVELLIATLVFSVILLVITMGIIQVTNVYYKGVNEANTQNTARTIMDTVSQAIQFNGGDVTQTGTADKNWHFFCVGTNKFNYRLGYELTGSSDHAMLLTSSQACSSDTNATTTGGREFLSPKTRLANLSVKQVGTSNLYKIDVIVVYGDDDLLTSTSVGTAPKCKEQSGSHFCSVSELSTTVARRITSGQ